MPRKAERYSGQGQLVPSGARRAVGLFLSFDGARAHRAKTVLLTGPTASTPTASTRAHFVLNTTRRGDGEATEDVFALAASTRCVGGRSGCVARCHRRR